MTEPERVGGAHADAEGREDHEVEDGEEEPCLEITDLLPEALPAVPETS